jgi:hypothetical protein
MRIYSERLARFFSVDPITAKYPELTPYQFASNRPIDGIDKDGLEWATYEEKAVVNGKTIIIKTDVLKIKVINKSNVLKSMSDIKTYAEAFKSSSESKVFSETINNEEIVYKTKVILDYTPEDPPIFMEINGKNTKIAPAYARLFLTDIVSTTDENGIKHFTSGNTLYQINGFKMEVAVSLDKVKVEISEFKETCEHEKGHSAGLNHPWKLSEAEIIAFPELNQLDGENMKNKTIKKSIYKNFMNSDENTDDKMKNNGTNKDIKQRKFMHEKIKESSNYEYNSETKDIQKKKG